MSRSKAKTAKRPKDPNAPKRSQSSYFLFMNERRPILKKENPDKSMTDISKLISAEWKVITNKQEYVDKAAKLKAKYQIALEEYQQTESYEKFQKVLAKWKKEQNAAKRGRQNIKLHWRNISRQRATKSFKRFWPNGKRNKTQPKEEGKISNCIGGISADRELRKVSKGS